MADEPDYTVDPEALRDAASAIGAAVAPAAGIVERHDALVAALRQALTGPGAHAPDPADGGRFPEAPVRPDPAAPAVGPIDLGDVEAVLESVLSNVAGGMREVARLGEEIAEALELAVDHYRQAEQQAEQHAARQTQPGNG